MYGRDYGVPGMAQSVPHPQNQSPIDLNQQVTGLRYGEQCLWSTQMHVNATALANGTFRLFSTAQNNIGQGFVRQLTVAETNLLLAGRVPNGVAYDVYGLACQVYAADGAGDAAGRVINTPFNDITGQADGVDQLLNVMNNGTLAWNFQQAVIDIAPISMIGAGGGVFGSYAGDNAAAGATTGWGATNNGAGGIYRYLNNLVLLPGDTVFNLLLRYGNRALAVAGSSIVVRVCLLGMYRAVLEVA